MFLALYFLSKPRRLPNRKPYIGKFVAGAGFLVATICAGAAIQLELVDTYKELVREGGYEKDFLDDFVYQSSQAMAYMYTTTMSVFGGAVGGSLLYAGLYNRAD